MPGHDDARARAGRAGQRRGVPGGVDHRDVGGAAVRRGLGDMLGARATIRSRAASSARLAEELLRQPAAAKTCEEPVVTGPRLLPHHLDSAATASTPCRPRTREAARAAPGRTGSGCRRTTAADSRRPRGRRSRTRSGRRQIDAIGGEIVAGQVPAPVGARCVAIASASSPRYRAAAPSRAICSSVSPRSGSRSTSPATSREPSGPL